MTIEKADLLIEIRCEELPPELLEKISRHLSGRIAADLGLAGFCPRPAPCKTFATCRRLVSLIPAVSEKVAGQQQHRRGPARAAAFDDSGAPTKALTGFLQANDATVDDLVDMEHKGKQYVALEQSLPERSLDDALGPIIEQVLANNSFPRNMRWGDSSWRFVRPVRGLCIVHGEREVKTTAYGITSSNKTTGHRHVNPVEIEITSAKGYEDIMRDQGQVLTKTAARHAAILDQAWAIHGVDEPPDDSGEYDELLADNAPVCEWPTVVEVDFDEKFLELPVELLWLCLRKHLRCSHFEPRAGRRGNAALFVADNKPDDMAGMVAGIERVVAARLEDALYIYKQDVETSLEQLASHLEGMTYLKELGNMTARQARLARIVPVFMAEVLGVDEAARLDLATQAAAACHVGLATATVQEYPEMDGVMAGIKLAGPAGEVIRSVRAGAWQRDMPHAEEVAALVLADDLERLVAFTLHRGLPKGSGDPHGLRQSALRVLQMLLGFQVEADLWILLRPVLAAVCPNTSDEALVPLADFLLGRLPHVIEQAGASLLQDYPKRDMHPRAVMAILDVWPVDPRSPLPVREVLERMLAIDLLLERKEDLANVVAVHKRLDNIVSASKLEVPDDALPSKELYQDPVEAGLQAATAQAREAIDVCVHMAHEQRCERLVRAAAVLGPALDAFVGKVRMDIDDQAIGTNRLALVKEARAAFNAFANMRMLYS